MGGPVLVQVFGVLITVVEWKKIVFRGQWVLAPFPSRVESAGNPETENWGLVAQRSEENSGFHNQKYHFVGREPC